MVEQKSNKKIRYAVVGLGHIAQAAVLPAFEHAKENSELTAFVSDNPTKIVELAEKYHVKNSWSYEEYEACLNSGEIDAVYIALPNSLHKEFTVRAAKAGIHVLCEKPMAVTVDECKAMIEAVRSNHLKLMIAYRLHFDQANMEVVDIINSGEIGSPKIFNSVFTMQLKEGNIRSERELGGGPLRDIGIYCINAARYIFRDEPIEVIAFASKDASDERFKEIDEMCSVVLKFSENRLANFICSFGAAPVSRYQVLGANGDVTVDPAYEYVDKLKYRVTVDGKVMADKAISQHDQFAPELHHFSHCILNDIEPQPSGEEGLADIRIIQAIEQSIGSGKAVTVDGVYPSSRPGKEQIMIKPAVKKQPLVEVESASKK